MDATLYRSYRETHRVYADTRAIAHFSTCFRFEKTFPRMMLSNITPAAMDAYRQQWQTDLRHDASRHWDWEQIVADRNADPKQFQLALWNQRVGQPVATKDLHGLVIGRTSSAGYAVRIEYIEGYPAVGNPFQGHVFPIAEMALTYYGFLINAACMKIVNPLPGAVRYYRSRDFVPVDDRSDTSDLVKMLGEDHDEFGAENTATAYISPSRVR
ncbi:hypothetical protein [Arenibaculum sp.]|jgi:hypothetical protein|uniref:hypothetical protein n=1 Tax=Arenibaculum sp. TaxID=2865862 RepID=UPI002E16838D|nr:hypothetical protein [Arenibaculum sp.]